MNKYEANKFLYWLTNLDEPDNPARQTVTLNQIIDRARAVLSTDPAEPDRCNEELARILSNLDRCTHGRHRADKCFDCPDGWSAGNPHIPAPGQVVGYDRLGEPYVIPAIGKSFADPAAWCQEPV